MKDSIKEQEYYIPHQNEKLHLKRFSIHNHGVPIFMLHGSMESGKIFYSKSKKGLAPFLAARGFDVFVADMSGRGKSIPKLNSNNKSSQTTTITSEIPAFVSFIAKLKENVPQHWIAHSWGGVLMLAYVARFGSEGIASMTFFATKRRIAVVHLERILKVDLIWNLLGRLSSKIYGYFPSKNLRIGSDNEPKAFHRQVVSWVYSKGWKDPEDGFDYNEAFRKVSIPRTLYLAAKDDQFLGHPKDVRRLMKEVGNVSDVFVLLSKENGHLHDYDHINILTHPKAASDHFLIVEEWIRK